AKHAARTARPDVGYAHAVLVRLGHHAVRRYDREHEVIRRLSACVVAGVIDGLEAAVGWDAAHAGKRRRESASCWWNAEHRAERVRELDAMQASPAIVVLIGRAEERRRREHVEPRTHALQYDEVAPIGRRGNARHGEEVDAGSADA